MAGTEAVLRVLVVDDEMPARLRLRDLLGDMRGSAQRSGRRRGYRARG